MKNILVTGSSGTIGTRLCERLLYNGYRVTGVDKSPNRWNKEVNAVTLIGDLRESKTLRTLPSSFGLVIHLAANARVYNLVVDPALAFDNVWTTFEVLEFCRRNAIPRLLFASSREVYSNTRGLKRSEEEACIDSCESPYTASKVSGEALVRAYERCYGIRAITTRFSNVYGMYDVSDRIIPLFIRAALQNADMPVYGRDKILDFTYIDDTVAGICGCIQRFDVVAGKTFNIASGKGTRIIDVAETVRRQIGSASKARLGDSRTGEVIQFVANIAAARRCLSFEPQVEIEEGVSRSIIWYSRHADILFGDRREKGTSVIAELCTTNFHP